LFVKQRGEIIHGANEIYMTLPLEDRLVHQGLPFQKHQKAVQKQKVNRVVYAVKLKEQNYNR